MPVRNQKLLRLSLAEALCLSCCSWTGPPAVSAPLVCMWDSLSRGLATRGMFSLLKPQDSLCFGLSKGPCSGLPSPPTPGQLVGLAPGPGFHPWHPGAILLWSMRTGADCPPRLRPWPQGLQPR